MIEQQVRKLDALIGREVAEVAPAVGILRRLP